MIMPCKVKQLPQFSRKYGLSVQYLADLVG